MKIEHQGSLLTGEVAVSNDDRYIFNQSVTLKDQAKKDFLELTINLITDKGAKYIAGVFRLYQSEMVRSEGERLVLSLSKCIDT
jgi:ligand-binding sensor protein